eukprot:1267182-Pyramimonas_sp.AAC.1
MERSRGLSQSAVRATGTRGTAFARSKTFSSRSILSTRDWFSASSFVILSSVATSWATIEFKRADMRSSMPLSKGIVLLEID